jgi:hypothetical protein
MTVVHVTASQTKNASIGSRLQTVTKMPIMASSS